MIDPTDIIETHGMKNNRRNRIWLRAVYYTTLIVFAPVEIVKYVFGR